MVTKHMLYIALLTMTVAYGQGIELQRKYRSDAMQTFKNFITESDSVSSVAGIFNVRTHTVYTSSDIYLDTPDHILFKLGFSLRFRQRIDSKGLTSYSFQLKTEMADSNGMRIEVDEADLSFYRIYNSENYTTLRGLLDDLFAHATSDKIHGYDAILSAWIYDKARAPIAPFQKLIYLHGDVFTPEKLSALRPVCLGISKRTRSHIYVDLKNYEGEFGRLFRNPEAVKEKLDYFENNETAVWVMESSLDSSVFVSLEEKLNPKIIEEYEVENKYQFDETGVLLINAFDEVLIRRFQLYKNVDSKYRQSMLYFFEQER